MGRTSIKSLFPRSRVEIFRNERTRSTPLHPKLMFWRVSNNLGAFWTIWFAYETRCHWTPNSCFGAFHTIWAHLGPFGCLTKLGAKRAELVQKFVTESHVGIFHNELTRSTPLDPKLMFWRILYYLGVFGTIVCLMKLGAKWTELVQKVRFHEVASKFFATNAPYPIAS